MPQLAVQFRCNGDDLAPTFIDFLTLEQGVVVDPFPCPCGPSEP